MSKTNSHQFCGTMGERIEQGLIAKNQKKQVIAWVLDVVSRMGENVSKRQRDKFNTACVAFDETTGRLYFGRNGGIDKLALNCILQLKKFCLKLT